MQVSKATFTVGGGTALLVLPDRRSIMYGVSTGGNNVTVLQSFDFNDDLEDETGWNVNAAVEVPLIGAGGKQKAIALSGFWASVDDDDRETCSSIGQSCVISALVDNPAASQLVGLGGVAGQGLTTKSEREIDQWGLSLETKMYATPDVMGVTKAPNRRYWALGADFRGLNQEINATVTGINGVFNATYTEDLDTTYYGAFAAYGADYTPFLFKGLWDRMGLQSSFRVQGGIYYADTDYSGAINNPRAGPTATSALSLSDDDVAFIGGITLETKKQIGARTTLSLKSEYEYYSYAPTVFLNQVDVLPGGGVGAANGQNGTVISDNDAFSARTSLRLTIGLGSRDLYK